MIRSALIIFLVNYCAFLFSQELQYSRNFESLKKNLPVAIINKHPNYFHVLRYNRAIHDFTIERRNKASAEIIAFTALRLDSVNASWFDYENLDYVLHEYNHHLYFIFEKVLNAKREIYLKTIDTNGKASGFKLLAVLEKDNNMSDFSFKFKLMAQNKLLIVGSQNYLNGSVKKFAELFDLESKEKMWLKKLPIENPLTGYSHSFTCNTKGDLFYVLIKSEIEYYKRMYVDHRQIEVPVFIYTSIDIVSFIHVNSSLNKKPLPINGINGMNSIVLYPNDSTLSLFMYYSKGEEPKSEKVFFLTQQWVCDLSSEVYYQTSSLSESIDKQLSYYDGTDYKTAADKSFSTLESYYQNESDYEIAEHKLPSNDKELLLLKWEKKNGAVLQQQLIPRKASYFDERVRIKNIGRANILSMGETCYVLLLESRANAKMQLADYKHKTFKKLKTIYNANLVMYMLNKSGELSRKLIYENDEFDCIPLNYQTDRKEFILFLDGSRYEKFAILNLNQL